MTFESFITRLYAEVGNKQTKTLDLLKQITVRQLKEFSSWRTVFTEATFSFPTAVDRESYGPEAAGFPVDAVSVDRLYYAIGDSRVPIPGPLSAEALRFNFPALVSTTYPQGWGWHGRRILLSSPASQVLTLSGDYTRDAQRDATTGALIAESGTDKAENPWFERGELALRYAVLAEYFSHPLFRDAEAAGAALGQRNQYLKTLQDEWWAHQPRGAQAPAYMGGYLDGDDALAGALW